jgi:hypothetical protein
VERIDRYDVLALVREDGALSVYLARDTTFGCDVSLETAPVDAIDAVSALRMEARAKRAASDDVDVRVFEDLDRGLFCVATRKTIRARRADARPGRSEPTFHTMPRIVPFLLVGAALVACGVAIGATVYMSNPNRGGSPGPAPSAAPIVSSDAAGLTWEGCPPTTVTIDGGCIDASPMLLTDCGTDCEAAAPTCPKGPDGAIRACASRDDAAKACARQGGALPTEDQWSRGKALGMKIDEPAAEWSMPSAAGSSNGFRCFHPSSPIE